MKIDPMVSAMTVAIAAVLFLAAHRACAQGERAEASQVLEGNVYLPDGGPTWGDMPPPTPTRISIRRFGSEVGSISIAEDGGVWCCGLGCASARGEITQDPPDGGCP